MKHWTTIAIVAGAVLFWGGVSYWKIGVWKECRLEQSFGYCMALVSK